MAEPLKNLYTRELVESLATVLKRRYGGFDQTGFINHVLDHEWQQRELKDRMGHISASLNAYLPMSYAQAVRILMQVAPGLSGFQYMFFPGFVESYGLDHFDDSMIALECFTRHSSSEFAVRPFIKTYGPQMMQQMYTWSKSDNHHVRRLASEGCRPRLPWAMALPAFKQDPSPVLPILNNLKNDESEYVRRSVANNLNDISKDNPRMVLSLGREWLGQSPETDWIVKHACRSLLKQGEPEALELFGFGKPDHVRLANFKVQKDVRVGERLEFSFTLESSRRILGKQRIEYGIDFLKKNGSLSRKVFSISESDIQAKDKAVAKSHSFRNITTRRYYPGEHRLCIIVNGVEMGRSAFQLMD